MANQSRHSSLCSQSDCLFKGSPPHPLGACQTRSTARARDSAGAVAAATRRRRLLRVRLAPPRPPARPSSPPPPRGLPRPRCAAGPVTLAPRRPRSILRSRPPLASCSSRSVRQQSASPGHARRRGDPTGSASRRAGVRARRQWRRRSGFGGAGAASAPFPEVSARLPGELSLARGAGRPALCQRCARGAGCQGTGGHASPAGTRASARPPAPALAAPLRLLGPAALRAAAWPCGAGGPGDPRRAEALGVAALALPAQRSRGPARRDRLGRGRVS